MDATKARALNTMKQKIKKTTKEYETDLKAYTADPEAFVSTFNSTNQPEVVSKPKKVKKTKAEGGEDEEEEDDAFTTVGKGGKLYSLGSGDLYKNLAAIQEARGKKVWLKIWRPQRGCRS